MVNWGTIERPLFYLMSVRCDMCYRRALIVVSKAAMLFVALRLAGIPCNADEPSVKHGRIPPALIERLRIVVTERAPDVKIEVEDDDEGGGCRFVERCVRYSEHGVKGKLKEDGFKKESWRSIGPSSDGFLLELYWLPRLGGGAGTGLRLRYWDSSASCYKLPDDSGYFRMSWAFGTNTDMTILDAV